MEESSIQTIDNGGAEEEEIATLRFLDSLDAYVSLLNSLFSTLRQGWLELASVRHSMGSSRISSALFDLKVQSASTTCQVADSADGSPSVSPHFTLSKWVSSREGKCSGEDLTQLQKESSSSKLRRRGAPNSSDGADDANSAINDSHSTVDNMIQKERSKSLSVFGALVPPKLRAAQGSFETALEIIVELANMRASMLSSYSQVQQEMAENGDSS